MIKICGIKLVNWYSYNYARCELSDFSLIAGKNKIGKTTLLDAIKYSLLGDSSFNASTDNKSSDRTIYSYTRWLLNATDNI